jgi:hypothetical protein
LYLFELSQSKMWAEIPFGPSFLREKAIGTEKERV